MKSLQAPNLKTKVLTKAMYAAIHSYDEQAFDNMSEGSEKTSFIIKKSLQPVPSQGMVEQAKKTWQLQTPVMERKRLKTPYRVRWPNLNKAVNYLQKGCFN